MPGRMPAYFFGHGNPMNALEQNSYTRGWSKIGRETVRPKAILCVSAHWYVPGSAVTISTSPRTIHDFGGFPQPLYEVNYPAPGDREELQASGALHRAIVARALAPPLTSCA